MLKNMVLLFLLSFSSIAFAADVPQVVLDNEKYDKKMCIERTANDCINNICLTSSKLDCTQKCRQEAQDKCK